MIIRDEIYQKASEFKVDPSVIEKDYHLGLALKIIAESRSENDWIFRGGTALKKCYFSNYRFSEDLDFTLIHRELMSIEEIKSILERICRDADSQFGISLEFFNVTQEREEYGEEAFKGILHFQGVKGRSKIKIDLSFADKIFIKPQDRYISHLYSDSNVFGRPKIKTARLEEIIADKFMAISFIRTYPRNRDLFDIQYILKKEKLDQQLIKDTFEQKCDYRNLDKKLVREINKKHLEQFKNYWQAQLASLVGDLPDFSEVVNDIIKYRDKIFIS
jgi:predicted nucleotidyltransferase component of viral defense system